MKNLTAFTNPKTYIGLAVLGILALAFIANPVLAQDLDTAIGNNLTTMVENFVTGNFGLAIGIIAFLGAVGYCAYQRDRGSVMVIVVVILLLLVFYSAPTIVRALQSFGG